MKSAILFEYWPYAAVVFCGAGILVRFAITREQTTAFSLRDLVGRARLLLFTLSLLFLGHLAGLFFPRQILLWNSSPSRLYALEAVAFATGLSALAAWSVVMWRHLGNSGHSVGRQSAGAVFSSLLFTALLSGSLIALFLRWGSSWGAVTLAPYALSLLQGRPIVGLANGMPFLVRLHVFSAFLTLALLPATPAGAALIAALRRAGTWVSGPVSRLLDWARVAAGRLNPAAWIWPELD